MDTQYAKFLINNVDFSDCVKVGGVKCKIFDLDSKRSGRTLDGQMHRARTARKRQLTQTCVRITDTRLRALVNALDADFINVTYPDPQYGVVTKTFYGTEVESAIWAEVEGVLYWDQVTFVLTER